MTIPSRFLVHSFLMVISGAAVVSAQSVSSNLVEKARAAVTSVSTSATEAGTMRDMALVAVRNVVAAENDANEAFLLAVRSEDKKKLVAARKLLDGLSDSAREARASLEVISDYAREVRLVVSSAKEQEKIVQTAASEREALSAFVKIERLAKTAEKSTRKAQELAEVLKKQWLLPTASTNATIQPGR